MIPLVRLCPFDAVCVLIRHFLITLINGNSSHEWLQCQEIDGGNACMMSLRRNDGDTTSDVITSMTRDMMH